MMRYAGLFFRFASSSRIGLHVKGLFYRLAYVHLEMVGVTSIVKPGSVGHLMELKLLYET